jgi:hypothetical protein
MKVLSFGTVGKYEGYLNTLSRSLDEHGVRHETEVLEPHKKLQAALKKPQFILDRLDEPVLWIDADSFVTGPIELPDGDWDAGFLPHWGTHGGVVCCVLAFRPTEAAGSFLKRWAALCTPQKNSSGTEHDRMNLVLPEMKWNTIDLSECLRGKLVVNYKIRKEHYV